MTIRSLEVRTGSGGLLGTVPVGAPDSADYFIKNIDGLGPVDAVLAMSNFADYDGAIHHGARLAQRNIVITLGYSPNYVSGRDVGTLRKQAYLWFRPKSSIRLYVNDSDRERVYTHGYVEKVEPVLFSKDPEIQISIVCEDPYFASVTSITRNESANDNIDLSDYGDAPTPFTLNITPAVNFSRIDIRNGVDPNIIIAYPFAANDLIRVSVTPGSKFASVTRAGVTTTLLDRLQDSTLQMFLDDRVTAFNVVTAGGGTASYVMTLSPKWLGV